MGFPASITLGTILRGLPDFYRSTHKVVEIMRAYQFGYANPLWPKAGAMHAHFRAVMESYEAGGSGNKAFRRHVTILMGELNHQWTQNQSTRSSNITILWPHE